MKRMLRFSVQDLHSARYYHGCGTVLAQDGSGNKEVVIAGHYFSNYYTTVEIYSTTEDRWREGKSFVICRAARNSQAWHCVQLFRRPCRVNNKLFKFQTFSNFGFIGYFRDNAWRDRPLTGALSQLTMVTLFMRVSL